ncbi:MAG: 30S ribosomal protein S6 [SAR324 cluster bacterium]|nr:30S ribosomal protein S6 [SAR324 cluster bacterium]
MQGYEFFLIIDNSLSDEEAADVVKKYQEIVTENGGTVTSSKLWGRRKLAYLVNKKQFAIYYIIYFSAPSTVLALLKDKAAFDEFVLRSLPIKCDDLEKEITFLQTISEDPKINVNLYLDSKKGN